MINCDKITKHTKNMMFSLIDKTQINHNEYYTKLCKDKDKKIVGSDICVGTSCYVPMTDVKCPTNTEEMGDFHTHPKSYPKPSIWDILSSLSANHKFFCLGHAKSQPSKSDEFIIDCYNVKDNNLLELGNKAHVLRLKNDRSGFLNKYSEMESRLYELGYPRKIKDVLNKECLLTKKLRE